MKLGVAGVLAIVALGACRPVYEPGPPPPPVPVVGDECERAQERIEALEKHEAAERAKGAQVDPLESCFRDGDTAKPRHVTPAGKPFAAFCREAHADGRDVRPDCIAVVPSCKWLDAAYRTPRGTPCPGVSGK